MVCSAETREMLNNNPAPAMTTTSEEPPNEMKGSATPVGGTSESMTAIFNRALVMIHKVMPEASKAPNGSRARRATPNPRMTSRIYRQTTKIAPTAPNSSPMTAKILSVCGAGRKPNFCRPCPKPKPDHPPLMKAMVACRA